MLIAFVGKGGVGKDTATTYAASKYGFCRIAFADPVKRIAKNVFDLSDNVLWGESNLRNTKDRRYIRDGQAVSVREILQTTATEGFRAVYPAIWLEYLNRTTETILANPNLDYDPIEGIVFSPHPVNIKHFAINDLRFCNEAQYIQSKGGIIIKIVRESSIVDHKLTQHQSEMEMDDIVADYTIQNDSSLLELFQRVDAVMKNVLQ